MRGDVERRTGDIKQKCMLFGQPGRSGDCNDWTAEKEKRMEAAVAIGKVPADFWQRLRERYADLPRGAAGGREAAGVACDDRFFIAKTRAITAMVEEAGHYAVQALINDLACMGGEPRWFLSSLLLPEGKPREYEAETIFQQIGRACEKLNVAWSGGETEMAAGLTQPVIAACLFAEAPCPARFSSNQIQPHDRILFTKGLAVEATGVLGSVRGSVLAQKFEREFARKCRRFLFDPGMSVLPEARLAWGVPGIHALRNVAAGGLANAIHDLLQENCLGAAIEWPRVRIFPETKVLCEYFGLDPLGVAGAGSLLIVGEEKACAEVLHRLRAAGIMAGEIGRVLPPGEQRWLVEGAARAGLPRFERDEIMHTL